MARMSDEDVLREMRSESALNQARKEFAAGSARIEQVLSQRSGPTAIQLRRMEFEIVRKILGLFGVKPELTKGK